MPYPEGKFPCVLCGHDVAGHNLNVGCQACTCAATPGEANHNERVKEPYDGRILAITETRSHYKLRPEYGQPMAYKIIAEREVVEAANERLRQALADAPLPTVQCPTCLGSGAIAVGPWGARPPKVKCGLCQGKGKLERSVSEAFRAGVEMGRSSAYLGHYDQYDTGSLMFSPVDSPYAEDTEILGEVNHRKGF